MGSFERVGEVAQCPEQSGQSLRVEGALGEELRELFADEFQRLQLVVAELTQAGGTPDLERAKDVPALLHRRAQSVADLEAERAPHAIVCGIDADSVLLLHG